MMREEKKNDRIPLLSISCYFVSLIHVSY